MKKIIIFDCDGVIIDSLEIFMSAFVSACVKSGYKQISSREAFLNLFDGNLYDGMIMVGISKNDIPTILDNLKINFLRYQEEISLFQGIKDMLTQLANENIIYIVTSNISSIVENLLISKGINTFEKVIGAEKETSKVKKIQRIKAKHPNYSYFYVGDTKGDMVEGRLAGAQTIAVLWGWHDINKLKEAIPDFIVNTPQDLTNTIKNYNQIYSIT